MNKAAARIIINVQFIAAYGSYASQSSEKGVPMASKRGNGGSKGSDRGSMMFYVSILALIISAVGVVLGIMAFTLPADSDIAGLLGITQGYDASTLFGYGMVMIVQSAFGVVMGIFGVRAARSLYPPDGKPFFAFAVIALLLSIGGMVAAGSASLVSIVIDAICAYLAWGLLRQPLPKNKKKVRR